MTTLIAAVLVLGLLTSVHELGHLLAAKRAGLQVDEFGLGYPPRILTLARIGGTQYTLNLIFFGAFVRLAEEGEPGTHLSDQTKRIRAMFLLGGPLLNLLLAVVLFSMCFVSGWPVAHDLAVGVKVRPRSVAEAVGFENDDLIVAADGRRVSSTLDLILYARSVHGNVRAVTIRRRGRSFLLPLPAGAPWFVKPESRGVKLCNGAGWVESISYPWPQAIQQGLTQALTSAASLFALAFDVVRGMIPADMVRPVGPVGIAQLTSQAARQLVDTGGWFPLLHLTATLSAALAAINILPLPGLDGGRLLFIIIEALRGKRLDPSKENLIHFVGIALMLMLILVVTYHDITAPYPPGGR